MNIGAVLLERLPLAVSRRRDTQPRDDGHTWFADEGRSLVGTKRVTR